MHAPDVTAVTPALAPNLTDTVDVPRPTPAAEELPEHVGRYRVETLLGRGGFGLVYLAQDEQLHRPVAVKVPHSHLFSSSVDAEVYLTEARTVASLDHPHIVPVFDVGSDEQFPCFIVSKYIQGADLATWMQQHRLTWREAAELVATVAETLHYAHKQGLVHRDIKPGNVLLDRDGRPFVTDFGLALREHDAARGSRYAGTPAYMSPEQARGEGHRVDGRSDIFSLGVMLYELLIGRRPFSANSYLELLEQITTTDPRPPRQIDDGIPRELERICLKALSKRASDRYTTARDMNDDLRQFVSELPSGPASALRATPPVQPLPTPVAPEIVTPALATGASGSGSLTIIPKGLRSFDDHDADFFMELLPGPRDRNGVPESVRFWKSRILETDPDRTFSAGLLYGPSGCGKSSLVKAALLPQLPAHVATIYVEATPDDTELRLVRSLRKCCTLSEETGLTESIAAVRRGEARCAASKVLIVLDQFEQWLHARMDLHDTELIQALRQCDGIRVQCIVMVRDDFWMATTRFMRELEIRLVEGHNSAAVDLFPRRHAHKVLAAFGRAYGVLPDNPGEMSQGQSAFLEQAVNGLGSDGKVICVRLALFAEVMKGRPWTLATLHEVGGTEGIGVTFLEETFSASTAPPEHRYLQKAARAVLSALLPEPGADIKGHMRSVAELREAASPLTRPDEFQNLMRILDTELRLITPTDPAGAAPEDEHQPQTDGQYYQLTHDFLVPSLRQWLTRKQKETRRGRAELLLADRAAVWAARPENRQLPSLWQSLAIAWWTRRARWTEAERQMMQRAGRYHALQSLLLSAMLLVAGWAGHDWYGSLRAHALRDRLLDASTAETPSIVRDMAPFRRWIDPLLRDAADEADAAGERRQRLNAALALLPTEDRQVEYLASRLLDASPQEVMVVRDALAPHRRVLQDWLWMVAEDHAVEYAPRRLRAACALATYDPDSRRWAGVGAQVVNDLVNSPAVDLAIWMEALRPARSKLLVPLMAAYRDAGRRETERSLATDILADFAATEPDALADLVLEADEKQFPVIFPKLAAHGEQALALMQDELRNVETRLDEDGRESRGKRHANAAVTLLHLGQPEKLWPLLKGGSDPRCRTTLIHRLAALGVDFRLLAERLDQETDVSARRALLLALGEFDEARLSAATRHALIPAVQDLYRNAADPGLHSAAEWLLKTWEQQDWLQQVNETWRHDKVGRERQAALIALTVARPNALPRWYVTGQGHTMMVIPGPIEFQMGSPPDEARRHGGVDDSSETLHIRGIPRSFAVASREVTVEQFQQFRQDHEHHPTYARRPDCPVNLVTWYDAAAYCNWLSEQEGIPPEQWCYEPNLEGRYAEGMQVKAGFLSLRGYRLPTEAEWECACRAGTQTARFYGETEDLLSEYAWCSMNSQNREMSSVGMLKPNDFGLFDILGNAVEWCHEPAGPYPASAALPLHDRSDANAEIVLDRTSRTFRGGSFIYYSGLVRTACRFRRQPSSRLFDLSFRPARTIAVVEPPIGTAASN